VSNGLFSVRFIFKLERNKQKEPNWKLLTQTNMNECKFQNTYDRNEINTLEIITRFARLRQTNFKIQIAHMSTIRSLSRSKRTTPLPQCVPFNPLSPPTSHVTLSAMGRSLNDVVAGGTWLEKAGTMSPGGPSSSLGSPCSPEPQVTGAHSGRTRSPV